MEILLEKWNNIITSAETLTPPNLIYRDQDLLYRVIREACTEDVKEIVVDTAFALSRVQNILQNWHMNKDVAVTLYKGTEPLLIAYDIHKEIKAALNVKVNMPSGGYLFIQQTEALTVIDVNSGKFTSSSTQDETILKTNIEAVHEIARQLRLRNIGGMIIIDFIDMMSRADKLAMLEELEIALEPDKAKPQVGQLSDLGLVELTRHRQGQSLSEIFTKKCPHCQGSGYFMNELNFATPTAEGEYRAKAAKLKLPVNNFKKNNKNNKQNEKPQQEEIQTEQIQTAVMPEIQVENPSAVAVLEAEQTEKETKKRRGRKTRFDKDKNAEKVETPLVVTEDIQTAGTVIKVNEEIKPEIAEELIEEKLKQSEEQNSEKEISANTDSKTEKPVQDSEKSVEEISQEPDSQPSAEQEKEEKPKRTRRPNRGTSKKTRGRKTTAKEESVEKE